MSCSRADLHRFVGILESWFDSLLMPKLFQSKPKPPTNARPPQQQDKLALKEAKWGGYRDAAVKRLASLEEDGWAVAYTDGSSKMVRGWRQEGYGMWFAEASARNHAAPIPESERQSVSRGELRGVIHAILQRRQGERLVVVLDSEYVYKDIMEWSAKWRRHGWRTASGEVGHRDLWEQILWERKTAGEELHVHWVPSHLGVHGNHQADGLAEEGRQMHPHNRHGLPKRPRVEPMWADLGWRRCLVKFRPQGHPVTSAVSWRGDGALRWMPRHVVRGKRTPRLEALGQTQARASRGDRSVVRK